MALLDTKIMVPKETTLYSALLPLLAVDLEQKLLGLLTAVAVDRVVVGMALPLVAQAILLR